MTVIEKFCENLEQLDLEIIEENRKLREELKETEQRIMEYYHTNHHCNSKNTERLIGLIHSIIEWLDTNHLLETSEDTEILSESESNSTGDR